ncbi:MAG: hypothetical protein ACYC0B_02615 [Gemmatimonadaceae bacterium]
MNRRKSTILLLVTATCLACSSSDERAVPVPPAGSSLEIIIDDSASAPTADATVAALAGMCLRGDPAQGQLWSVDRIGDTLAVLPLEQLVTLAPRDSARLTARLSRTADGLPGDTTVADFRGLPVVIRDAWLLLPTPEDTTFIAIAARRIPIESAPLEEQLTLLAAPSRGAGTGDALVATWFARSAGAEDSLETREPVLAFASPDSVVRLVLVRESAGSPRVEVLARLDGRWRRQWIGTLAPCG